MVTHIAKYSPHWYVASSGKANSVADVRQENLRVSISGLTDVPLRGNTLSSKNSVCNNCTKRSVRLTKKLGPGSTTGNDFDFEAAIIRVALSAVDLSEV